MSTSSNPLTRHSRQRRQRRRREVRLLSVCTLAVAAAVCASVVNGSVHDAPAEPPEAPPSFTSPAVPSGSPSMAPPSASSPPAAPAPVAATAVARSASGVLQQVTGVIPDSTRPGRPVKYLLEVEQGYGVDPAEYAATVQTVLGDAQGWEVKDKVHFVQVTQAQLAQGVKPDFKISLVSPALVDRFCAPLDTKGEVSCFNNGRVSLNVMRWLASAPSYGQDLARYRIYLINHEVGHAIGHNHEACPGPGKPAPVMLQQTLGLQGCTAWPYPVPPAR